MKKHLWLGVLLFLLCHSVAAQNDEFESSRIEGFDVPNAIRGTAIAPNTLFAGTALNGPGGNNDAFIIDTTTDTAMALLTGVPVWGATFDTANQRFLYTTEGGADSPVDGAPLYELPIATGTPSLLGVINDGAGTDFRIDGLAMSGGVLFGSRAAAAADGLYSIDLTTFTATLEFGFTDSISGIDADPDSGLIYGANDTTGQLVTIDPVADTITNIAAYPDPGETDLDGVAAGGGRVFMVPDDDAPGLIYVYDIATDTFLTPLTAPWGATADTFSGAAFFGGTVLPEPVEVPVLGGPWTLALLLGILSLAGFAVLRQRDSEA